MPALDCAVSILTQVEAHNARNPDRPLLVGAGLHAGDAIAYDDQYVGGAVIVASGIAFDRPTLEVPAGRTFPLLFENRDFASHDVAIYPENGNDALFVGEVFSGPDSRIYQVGALPAGTYRFECQVHPQMDGKLIAKPG